MASATKIVSIGNSFGVILPKELLTELHLEKGDTVYVNRSGGTIQLSPQDENFDVKMEAANQVIRRYRDTLKKLAE